MKNVNAILKIGFCVLALSPAGVMAQTASTSTSASASSSAPAGVNGPILQKVLEASAKGECPADLMGQGLLDACHQQIAAIQPMLTAKGKITKLEFLGMQGQGEMWRVTYEHGTQVWGIFVGPGGKVEGMGTQDN